MKIMENPFLWLVCYNLSLLRRPRFVLDSFHLEITIMVIRRRRGKQFSPSMAAAAEVERVRVGG